MGLRLALPWDEVKELLKENDSTLTDEDLKLEEGNEDELIRRLSRKMGKHPAEVQAYVESISSNSGRAG